MPLFLQKIADIKRYDLVLFCDIDLLWEADVQRDLGDRREEFRAIYLEELRPRRIEYLTIRGQGSARLRSAIEAVGNHFDLGK